MNNDIIAAMAKEIARGERGIPTPQEIEEQIEDIYPQRSLTVAEAAEHTGITAHTLRYYERVGLITVERDARGHRMYSGETIGRAVFLYRMRCSGMSIERLREYVALLHDGDPAHRRRQAILREHRQSLATEIAELQIALALTDYKIVHYQDVAGSTVPAREGMGA